MAIISKITIKTHLLTLQTTRKSTFGESVKNKPSNGLG